MKRYGHLYEKITDIENLKTAHINARKGKTFYKEVKMVDKNPEYYAKEISNMLINKTYKVSDYEVFERIDKGKKRQISKLPYYPDRIVQWAILQQINFIFEKSFIYDTYSSIPGRGMHFGLKRVKNAMKDKYNTKYCLKIDVKKYYPHIKHIILKEKLRRKIKDPDLLWLLNVIIDSYSPGIPIGNYLSQYFANYYLTFFDRYCKEHLKIKHYFRYMDDIVILHKNKKYLHWLKKHFDWWLEKELELKIKSNWQVFPAHKRGIDFLGYRIFGDFILLRNSTKRRMVKKMKKISKHNIVSNKDNSSIQSYKGWLKHCNAHNLYTKHIKPLEVKYA